MCNHYILNPTCQPVNPGRQVDMSTNVEEGVDEDGIQQGIMGASNN